MFEDYCHKPWPSNNLTKTILPSNPDMSRHPNVEKLSKNHPKSLGSVAQ